ncbi:MAG: hypothetical protein JO372_03800 [Solirubrobacterales bacterium]|nr:hypothetical protein [Solirubrobacterales bacterium]
MEIALRLRKLAPWLVESYTGPSELAARVDAERPRVGAGELRERVRALRDRLDQNANIAMLLDQGQSDDEAKAYARRWMLEDDKCVGKVLASLTSRRWRPYESCYPEGLRLCQRFMAGDRTRFPRLLQEQLTTVDLLQAASEVSQPR